MGLFLIPLFLLSCTRVEVSKKDKVLVELGIAAGLLLKTAGCHAEIQAGKVKVSVGTKDGKDSEKESGNSKTEDHSTKGKSSRAAAKEKR